MVRLKFVLLCSAFALLLSCSGGGRAELSYSEDSFKEGRLEKLRTYDCEPLGVLNPAVVKHHPSGAILLLERGVKSQLKVLDSVDGSVESLLPTGRGPGEAVTPWDLSVDAAGTLWVSDLATRKLISFAIGSDGSFRFDGERKLQSQFMRAIPFRDEETLILASSSSGNRMCVLDAAGAAVDTVGSFPYSDLLDKSVLRNSVFQSDLAVAHDGGVIVCCKSFNVIDVYAPDLSECRRLVGPEPIDVGVVARETPMGMICMPRSRSSRFLTGWRPEPENSWWVMSGLIRKALWQLPREPLNSCCSIARAVHPKSLRLQALSGLSMWTGRIEMYISLPLTKRHGLRYMVLIDNVARLSAGVQNLMADTDNGLLLWKCRLSDLNGR